MEAKKSNLSCWNAPAVGGFTWCQNGYEMLFDGFGMPSRIPKMVKVPHAFKKDVPCGYLERHACRDCEGCKWRDAEGVAAEPTA